MSMISSQVDELRAMADRLRDHGTFTGFGGTASTDPMMLESATLMRRAADTIWELRCKCADLMDEREGLRRDTRRDEPPYDELIEALRRDWEIEASWDGLRRFWYVGWTDEHVARCKECAEGLGAYCDSLCDPLKAENAKLRELVRDMWLQLLDAYDAKELGEFADRMRELGLEVGE